MIHVVLYEPEIPGNTGNIIMKASNNCRIYNINVTYTITPNAPTLSTQSKTITVTETLEVIPDGYINTNSEEFYNNYVNMNDVVDFEATDAGLMLHFSDGTGYWWER